MTAIARPAATSDQRIILDGVSWETYEHLLSDFAQRPSVRLTYDEGVLEIMVVSYEHERLKTIIGDLVVRLAYELDIDYEASGSTTFCRESLGKGFESDESFYFTHLEQIRQRSTIDLAQDPPPDLVVEIDLSSPSLSKFSIFAQLCVVEVWRYHQDRLTIYQLDQGEYREGESSLFLSGVTAPAITELMNARQELPPNIWQRRVSDYARQIQS